VAEKREIQDLPDLNQMSTTITYDLAWLTTTKLVERFWDQRQRKEFRFYDLAELYHENTKFRRYQAFQITLSGDVFMGQPPIIEATTRIFKEYPNRPRIRLPLEDLALNKPLDETMLLRRSSRDYTGEPITVKDLSKLLYYTNGITARFDYKERFTGKVLRQFLRASASGGALYPIEIYVGVINVTGMEPGIYHYNVYEHSLEALKVDKDFPSIFPDAFPIHPETVPVDKSAVVLILSAMFERSKAKYGPRSYRYILQESGHIAQNAYLVATACELGTVAVAGFYDDDIDEWLGVDGVDETAVYTIVIGKARPSPALVPINPENFTAGVKSLFEE